jgi:hypothetical protein
LSPKKRQIVSADEACDPKSDEDELDFAPKERQPKQTSSSDENESEDFTPTRSQAVNDPHAVSSDDDFVTAVVKQEIQSQSGFTQAMVTKARQSIAGTSSSSPSTPLSAGQIAQKGRGSTNVVPNYIVMSGACRKAIDDDINQKFLEHGECTCFLRPNSPNYRPNSLKLSS